MAANDTGNAGYAGDGVCSVMPEMVGDLRCWLVMPVSLFWHLFILRPVCLALNTF